MEQLTHLLHPDTCTVDNLYLVKQQVSKPLAYIPHNSVFDQENLQKLPNMGWIKDIEATLINQNLDAFFDTLVSEAEWGHEGVPVISLDLETTGLDKTVSFIGGHFDPRTKIVGICIGVNGTKGYYIPVRHSEKDMVRNAPLDEVTHLMQRVQDTFTCIYHNAGYDREVLETNGIRLNPTYIDTMLLAINLGLKERYFQVGLKLLSEKLLGRHMLELKDIVKSKKEIQLTLTCAKSLVMYGVSDAVNTFALFAKFTDQKNPNNPYVVNKTAMLLDVKASDATRYMFRLGLPIDYSHLGGVIRTLIRRKILIEEHFITKISKDVPIGSAEKTGILMGNQLWDDFQSHYSNVEDKDSLWDSFKVEVLDKFYMEVKEKELKGGTKKITYSSGDDILVSLNKRAKTTPWVKPATAERLIMTANWISTFRSLQHDIGVFIKMYRYSYSDDLNFHRVGVGLKYNGTVTTRFSNASGSGSLDRVTITRGAKATTTAFVEASGACGINLQGINSDKAKTGKVLRVKNLPKELQRELDILSNKVELELRNTLEGM